MAKRSLRDTVKNIAPTTIVLLLVKRVMKISRSFWAIPTALILVTSSLAYYLVHLDQLFSDSDNKLLARLNDLEPNAALSLMQVVATSVITITSIAFSMTLVVLTMASQQFGPRLIGNFIEDKRTQCVLGVFTATFVYCILTMRAIKTDPASGFMPGMTVSLGLFLAVFSVFTLIYFIHHVALSIQADNLIKHVSRSMGEDLEKITDDYHKHHNQGAKLVDKQSFANSKDMLCPKGGYIQGINYAGLADFAKRYKGVIELKVRAGHHLLKGIPIAQMFSNSQLDQKSTDIEHLLVIGSERTTLQDPEFRINQLVEIALRALSPSINDPQTAIRCIDSLAEQLSKFAHKDISNTVVVDDDGVLRVITCLPTFDGLIACSFDQIRQAANPHVSVSARLLEVLHQLLLLSKSQGANQQTLMKQVESIELAFMYKSLSFVERQVVAIRVLECNKAVFQE